LIHAGYLELSLQQLITVIIGPAVVIGAAGKGFLQLSPNQYLDFSSSERSMVAHGRVG